MIQHWPVTTHYGKTAMAATRWFRVLHMGVLLLAVNASAAIIGHPASAQTPQARAVMKGPPIKIVAFGDSLTAGYLLANGEAFPDVLARALKARDWQVEIINAGVSGDTTSAARDRLAWAVPADTEAVILEFGANDTLRGVDPAITRQNLDAIVTTLKAQRAEVLLGGMVASRSMGETYTRAFDSIYPDLTAKHGVLLYPFFLAATALKPTLALADGLHPNAKGVEAIVADILPQVEALLGRVKAKRAGP